MAMTASALLSYRDAATYLSVSESTLRRLYRSGEIPAVPIGPRMIRFRLADLDAWIEARKTT